MQRFTRNGHFDFHRTTPVQLTRRQLVFRKMRCSTVQVLATCLFVVTLGYLHMRFNGGLAFEVAEDRTVSAMLANVERMALNVVLGEDEEPLAPNPFYGASLRSPLDSMPAASLRSGDVRQAAPNFYAVFYDSTTEINP